MKQAKHTPGPWTLKHNSFNCSCKGICNEDSIGSIASEAIGVYVARIDIDPGDGKDVEYANARLIAAAPDLLEACRDIKNFLANLENGTRRDDPLYGLRMMFHKPLHAVLDAAIAKAEGDAICGTNAEYNKGSEQGSFEESNG